MIFWSGCAWKGTRDQVVAKDPLTIDGSQGEGGGQIVRSSLSLSMVTGRGVIIDNIRAGRKKPGLLRQHLTAVRAAAEICSAGVEGDELRSSRLVFEPGPVCGDSYSFHIGTAGSTTLVLQTILPPLMITGAPSTVFIEGGTHNPMAPPFDFLKTTYLPLLARIGPVVELHLERYGFFPGGGGRIRAEITPSRTLGQLRLMDGGMVSNCRTRAVVARLPEDIGKRECRTIARKLNWGDRSYSVESIREASGPGNVVFAEVERGGVTEVFTGFGERGLPAEKVARNVVRKVRRYCKADVPVGEYLADQLLLLLGIGAHLGTGGGEFRTLDLSEHARTHIDILQSFLIVAVQVETRGPDDVHVRVCQRL
jgi:RNA 3'-terminal phosphate cyclase (ATP)